MHIFRLFERRIINILYHSIILGGPMIAQKYLDNLFDIRWFQYGILHGGIENCRSTEYPSIFNLVDNPVNLRWIKRHAFNELIGKYVGTL